MQYLRDNASLTQIFEIDGWHITAIKAPVNKMKHAKIIRAAIKTISIDVPEKK
jgi:hypothetical protein